MTPAWIKRAAQKMKLITHLLRLIALFLFQVKAPAETLNPASAVENALLTSEEGMAIRADIHAHVLPDAPCLKRIPTRACHGGFHKVWVNSSFHRSFSQSFRRISLWPENGRSSCQRQKQRPVRFWLQWHCTRRLHSRQATTKTTSAELSSSSQEERIQMQVRQRRCDETEPFEISAFFLRPRLEASTLATEIHLLIISHAAKKARQPDQHNTRSSFASAPLSTLYCEQRGSASVRRYTHRRSIPGHRKRANREDLSRQKANQAQPQQPAAAVVWQHRLLRHAAGHSAAWAACHPRQR